MDKKLIEKRFASHLSSYNHYAKVQNDICCYMSSILTEYIDKNISRILEVGAGTGFLTKELTHHYPDAVWHINDLTSNVKPFIENINSCNKPITYVFGDAETICLPDNLDLMVSANAIQWFENPGKFIYDLKIKEGGYIALSTFGKQNFKEIFQTIGVGLNYPSQDEAANWLIHAGYDIVHNEEQVTKMDFTTPTEVLRHLKLTGVNSLGNYTWTKGKLERFCSEYISNFSNGDTVKLTYNPLIIIGRRKTKTTN